MPGRINDEDIATVRERARIDEVVGSHVALRNAGSGTMKGLCPFHDEKTPSFQVNPARGFYYCFGCGEGGDVISFVQKIDNLSFTETVERLADRVGIQLRYTDGGASAARARAAAAADGGAPGGGGVLRRAAVGHRGGHRPPVPQPSGASTGRPRSTSGSATPRRTAGRCAGT